MVQMVSMISSTKRDNENREKQDQANYKGPTFTQVLNKVVKESVPQDIINIPNIMNIRTIFICTLFNIFRSYASVSLIISLLGKYSSTFITCNRAVTQFS